MKKLKISSFISGYFLLISAFFLIIAVKILISCYFKSPWLFADETVYAETARNILHGEFYSKLLYCQTYPPGYSLFLSIAYIFSYNNVAPYQIMQVINSFLTSSIIFPAYFLLKKYCPKNFSLLGSVFVAILPSVVLYNFIAMSENLFIPLFTFSLWFLIESFETNSRKWGIMAGFSIFLLFFTRTIGIAMIIGFFFALGYYALAQLKSKKPAAIIKENIYSVMAFCIPTILWIYYKSSLIADSGIYDTEAYYSVVFQAVSNIQSFISFLILSIHELEFLILASYFILFIMAFYFIYLIFKERPPNLGDICNQRNSHTMIAVKTGIIYFLVSSLLLIIITVSHMFLAVSQKNPFYNIFGRYIDPIVPIIAIFGLIGYYIILKNDFDKKRSIFLLFLTLLPLIFLFAIDFPSTYYKFPSTFTIFYIQTVITLLPVIQFIILLVITLFAIFIISLYYKKFWQLFIILLILISIIGINVSLQYQLKHSNHTGEIDQISRYLVLNSNESSRILMTNEDFVPDLGTQIWFGTQFNIKGYLVMGGTYASISNITNPKPKDYQYIISPRLLPYQIVAASKSGYKLYYLDRQENHSIEFPYRIDIGLNDEDKIENFYPAENDQIRWTKNYSKIFLEYPKYYGDMNMSIKIAGPRPSSQPANVIFLINNHNVGNITYIGEPKIVSIIVQDHYLNDYYNVLELDTNTWNPNDYGSEDKRNIGIQVDWVLVQKNNLTSSSNV